MHQTIIHPGETNMTLSLEELWETGEYADIHLQAKGPRWKTKTRIFSVHRSIISAGSDYFGDICNKNKVFEK